MSFPRRPHRKRADKASDAEILKITTHMNMRSLRILNAHILDQKLPDHQILDIAIRLYSAACSPVLARAVEKAPRRKAP